MLTKLNHRAKLVNQRLGFTATPRLTPRSTKPTSTMLDFRQPKLKKQPIKPHKRPQKLNPKYHVDPFSIFSQIIRIIPKTQPLQPANLSVWVVSRDSRFLPWVPTFKTSKQSFSLKTLSENTMETGFVKLFDSVNMLMRLIWRVVYTHV